MLLWRVRTHKTMLVCGGTVGGANAAAVAAIPEIMRVCCVAWRWVRAGQEPRRPRDPPGAGEHGLGWGGWGCWPTWGIPLSMV